MERLKTKHSKFYCRRCRKPCAGETCSVCGFSADYRRLDAEKNRLIKLGALKRRALREDPEREMVMAVYESTIDDEGLCCAPFEFETPASKWESTCFRASGLHLQQLAVSLLIGGFIAGFTILMGAGLEVAGINGILVGTVSVFLMARGDL